MSATLMHSKLLIYVMEEKWKPQCEYIENESRPLGIIMQQNFGVLFKTLISDER